eukprot:scaffold326949_cov86-Tisochrysis_lutea.AAC.1
MVWPGKGISGRAVARLSLYTTFARGAVAHTPPVVRINTPTPWAQRLVAKTSPRLADAMRRGLRSRVLWAGVGPRSNFVRSDNARVDSQLAGRSPCRVGIWVSRCLESLSIFRRVGQLGVAVLSLLRGCWSA